MAITKFDMSILSYLKKTLGLRLACAPQFSAVLIHLPTIPQLFGDLSRLNHHGSITYDQRRAFDQATCKNKSA